MTGYMNCPPVKSEYWADRLNATAMGQYLTRLEGSFIQESLTLHLNESGVIFDVGAGTGRFAIPLRRNGYRVIVGEINPLPLRILRSRELEISLILLDEKAKRFPIKESSVDCVLSIEVNALAASEWFFSECNRVLKQNGIIIFTTTNRCSYKGFYRKFLLKEDLSEHPWKRFEYVSSFQRIRLRFNNEGFRLTKAKGFNWLPARRASNNRLIPHFALIEKLLRLDLLLWLSPWIIVQARKFK